MPEIRKCPVTGKDFELSDKEMAFCERIGVPLPKLSPTERMRALMATRNEWKLYRRKCDSTGEEILSAYAPDSPFRVYKNEVWWGDSWDALDYGRDIDLGPNARPFFEQFAELQKVVPREGTSVFNSENCAYNSHIRESKNSYLNSLVFQCEDLYYSYWMVKDKDVFDSLYTNDSTLCYYCSDVNNCYGCVALEESDNCNDCFFSFQLRGCDHCIFSSNLVNKSYHIFNEPCTKEEFEEMKNKLLDGSWKNWQNAYQQFSDMKAKSIHRAAHNINCENVTGNHLYNCRNCDNCFESFDAEDCYNSVSLSGSKDTYNAYSAGWPGCEGGIYSCAVVRGSQRTAFSTYVWGSSDIFYSDSCRASNNCFGCIGLQHKNYCILNKQYTKEEYEELLPRIIEFMKKTGEWGEFFPPALSPFAYNETAAQDFMPLNEEEAVKMGWRWREKDTKEYKSASISEIPDKIEDVGDDITKELLACEQCQKNFKIIAKELEFYRKTKLPIPQNCPECRHNNRFKQRNPLKLFDNTCRKCQKKIQTTYSPDRPEKVYCESCFLKEVY